MSKGDVVTSQPVPSAPLTESDHLAADNINLVPNAPAENVISQPLKTENIHEMLTRSDADKEEEEERRRRRNEDFCCYACADSIGPDDAFCWYFYCRMYCQCLGYICESISNCVESCFEGCANCLNTCCESNQDGCCCGCCSDSPAGAPSDGGCCDDGCCDDGCCDGGCCDGGCCEGGDCDCGGCFD